MALKGGTPVGKSSERGEGKGKGRGCLAPMVISNKKLSYCWPPRDVKACQGLLKWTWK